MDTDQKIAIIGHIDVDPAVRDELVASIAELQRSTRESEPGCLVYLIAADPADPGRIQIVELWDSAASVDLHFEHPNFVATGVALRSVEHGAAEHHASTGSTPRTRSAARTGRRRAAFGTPPAEEKRSERDQTVQIPPLPAHRPSRRDEILDAAIAVFAAQGFVDTSISDVAEQAPRSR